MPSSFPWPLLFGAAAIAGCDARGAEWWIEFESTDLARRASTIEATVLEGGCTGTTVLFDERFAGASASMRPPALGPGAYGFRARAVDATCTLLASGCTDVVLPAAGVTTYLAATAPSHDDGCSLDAGRIDAGVTDGGPIDGGVRDGGRDVGMDAGSDTPIDAGTSDVPMPSCSDVFGSLGGFVLCTETATTCRFYTTVDGTCNARCALVGAACVGAEDDDSAGEACDSLGATTCSATGSDAICICSR
jgi:hypothetical protein